MTSLVSYPPAPAMTGMRPLASSARISTIRVRSASESVGLSPVVPTGTRKWVPASICRRPRRRTAASSTLPLRVNGVTNAVPHPVNGVLILALSSKRDHDSTKTDQLLQNTINHKGHKVTKTSGGSRDALHAQHILHREPTATP